MTPHHLLLAAALLGVTYAQADVRWRSVRAAELPSIFIDHELADGVHYAYQFRADGTFTCFAMGKEIRGAWHLTGNEFCWTQRKSTPVEECFEVERRDNQIRFLRGGSEAFSGSLSPLKAQVPTGAPR